ncbi:MAG: 3'-5' exonuclease [Anaerolineales bacterium]|nr:3'-5' exonuclease [Anaerolineales bacterium]
MLNDNQAAYISVDVETAGPNPSQYSLLSIGACALHALDRTFYIEIQPVNDNAIPQAMEINQLSMEKLAQEGVEPKEAMLRFEAWLLATAGEGKRPVFVAFNAAYDWMFVNDYFFRYLGRNPFGYTALDIKSYFMGLAGVTWAHTSKAHLSPRYLNNQPLTHNALQDAIDQARMFNQMLAEASRNRRERR